MTLQHTLKLACLSIGLASLVGCAYQPPAASHHHAPTIHRSYVVPANYVWRVPRRVVTESRRIYTYDGYLTPTLDYPY